jgi:hypothetical protein
MSAEQDLLEKFRALPPDKQREAMEFVDSLIEQSSPLKSARKPKQSGETLLSHRGSVKVAGEQDFAAVRQRVIEEHAQEVATLEP